MRVLVLQRDPVDLAQVAAGFRAEWRNCRILETTTEDMALARFCAEEPDLVVLDGAEDDGTGLASLREIRRISDVPIIILAGCGSEPDEVEALGLGADDYIVRPYCCDVLIARAKALLRRTGSPLPARTMPDFMAGELAMDFESHLVTLHGDPVRLTQVEYAVLYHLAQSDGHPVPEAELLDQVWGPFGCATSAELQRTVRHLEAKLEQQSGGHHFIEYLGDAGYELLAATGDAEAQHVVMSMA
jgi:DNA-binding response OmpR family regulator